MTLQPAIPVLRMFNVDMAKAFYVDWLGFKVDWQHEYGPDFPKYLQVSRDATILHLSEHYGDCSPGAKLIIHTDDVEALHAELGSRPNPYMRPGITLADWNAKVLQVTDPFGNRLLFNQALPDK
jgi:catechol 2,3-dioxygenase-like lactoylglutathione lyase family enzyme